MNAGSVAGVRVHAIKNPGTDDAVLVIDRVPEAARRRVAGARQYTVPPGTVLPLVNLKRRTSPMIAASGKRPRNAAQRLRAVDSDRC